MSKNILIFSDGTGQGGGVILDERRSNVYKMYRATRSGPDTSISPQKQIAFYDPGLGSSRDNEHIAFSWWRKATNFFAQAMGLGITRNIIDCYAFIIQHYQQGDRIYLYGFSRGAYTARCVGGVMAYCGIPTMENGQPINKDAATARRLAEEGVTRVYQHGVGKKEKDNRFANQRKELAANFRKKYASNAYKNGKEQRWSNVVPYFIGVWDTVAALGASWPYLITLFIGLGLAVWSLLALSFVFLRSLEWAPTSTDNAYLIWSGGLTVGLSVLAGLIYIMTHFRTAPGLTDPRWKTIHRRSWKMEFYDTYLNPRVQYAKHALAIDENRADFARVPWTDKGDNEHTKTDKWFEQTWFSGVHSDIGGSYPETESRLSDIALEWMVEHSKGAKHPVLVDSHYLRPYPAADGVQHDERKASRLPWKFGLRGVHNNAPLHPTVIERFKAKSVVHHDEVKPYRPEPLRGHDLTQHFFKE